MKSILTFVAASFLASLSFGQTPTSSDWTQWGGPHRDFQVDATAVPESINFKEVWRRDLGEGYSAVLAEDDFLFTMYRQDDQESVVCLNRATGATVWNHSYPAAMREGATTSFGKGPNSTPMLTDDSVISIGFNGDVFCLDKTSGKVRWKSNLIDDLGGTPVDMGYSQSPVAYKGKLLLPVGGEGKGMVALSLKDGAVIWSAQDLKNSYSTPVLVTVDGVDQMIFVMTDEVVAINPNDGQRFWSFPLTNQWSTHAFVPVWDSESKVLFVSSFRQSHALQMSSEGDKVDYEKKWSIPSAGVGFTNAVVVNGKIIGSTGGSRSPLVTGIDLQTGKVLWRERGFGVCNYVAIGDRVVLLDENGKLAVAEPNDSGLNISQQHQVLNAPKVWTVPTIVGNQLFVRDQKEIVAYHLN